MSKISNIQWTDATFNTTIGCTQYDTLCKNCYAERLDVRFNSGNSHWGINAERKTMSESYWKQPLSWNRKAFKENKRTKVFCASMGDWAEDNEVVAGERIKLFELIKKTPNLDWQLLTKRFDKVKGYLPNDWNHGYDNVWLGLSLGTQELANKYLDEFLKNKSKITFLSIEPLLEEVDLSRWLITGKIHQVLVGGESGNSTGKHKFRECKLEWIEKIVNDCQKYNVPVFVKQLGTFLSKELKLTDRHGGNMDEFPEHLRIRGFPKA